MTGGRGHGVEAMIFRPPGIDDDWRGGHEDGGHEEGGGEAAS